jgi:[acyl-carrier-protein] S-malonyltransferase/trans-AT polyketide synthase/acyltransferase/oxidoreductase domain-containing protein
MYAFPTAIVFPGQGSQRPGMGRDFHQRFAASRRTYEEASEALGLDLGRLCFEADERLGLTEYAQPAILATEIAMLRGLVEEHELDATRFAGHSLGEYTALVAAGVVPLPIALRVVRERGRLMQQAVPVGVGKMIAVIATGLDRTLVEQAIEGLPVDVANDNSPDQVVLSGRTAGVDEVARRLAASPAPPRLVTLDVSAPFHSTLMMPIERELAAVLAASSGEWNTTGAVRVTSNLTGGFHETDVTKIRERLVRQVSGTVRWQDNMRALVGGAIDGTKTILEIGPGRPLRGFFKAIGVGIVSITDVRSAERSLGAAEAAA